MAHPETVLEGTWEELALHADELRGKRLRLMVVNEETAAGKEFLPVEGSHPLTLAEALKDFIGSVEGSSEAYSEDSGAKFAASLVHKHQDGCL